MTLFAFEWPPELSAPWSDSYLHVQVWQYIGLLVILGLAYVTGKLTSSLITAIFKIRERLEHATIEMSTVRGMRRAISLLFAGILSFALIDELYLSTRIEREFIFIARGAIILGLLMLGLGVWDAFCDHLSQRSTGDKKSEKLLIPLTRKMVRGVIITAGFLVALAAYGVNVAGVITGLGISGLLLALAAKDSVENLFGSVTILLDMPFAIDDWIKVNGIEGVVEQINLRSTRIRTFEDSVVTLPNSNLIKAAVENYGARRMRRQRFFVRVAYDDSIGSINQALDNIRKTLRGIPEVHPDRQIVEMNDLSELSLGVLVQCFLEVDNLNDEMRLRGEIISLIIKELQGAGLRMPNQLVHPAIAAESERKKNS
ncbi:MAG: mechanosensitive ion channel family protein [Armatimonadetes bacterium]|nr:mechanosensitive ion channel family protein [Armatimonadota bacterium]